jgi:AcrR family transcriptional regulator
MSTPPAAPAQQGRIPLTRERVLHAALDLADREGLDAISMRRLGAELGVEAMSLYNHVASKDDVLDGIVEYVITDIELPTDFSDWKANVRYIARSYRRLALAHPNVVQLVATRPFNTLASLRPVEVGFEIFKAAGFDPEGSLHAFRLLAGFITGYTLAETGTFFGETAAEGQLKLTDVPSDDFPRLHELGQAIATDHDAEFDFGLDVILTGLEAKLAR